jgi:hypothetical protein
VSEHEVEKKDRINKDACVLHCLLAVRGADVAGVARSRMLDNVIAHQTLVTIMTAMFQG